MYCSAITKKKTNCTKKGTFKFNDSMYCTIHYKSLTTNEDIESPKIIKLKKKKVEKFLEYKERYLKSYDFISILGYGNFCDVFLISYDDKEYACKVSYSPKSSIYLESLILQNNQHSNIIQKYEYRMIKNGKKMEFEYLLLEFCEQSMIDRMKDEITEIDIKIWMFKLIDILELLHSNNIIYNDFKPENLMFLNENSNNIILIDFNATTNYINLTNGKTKEQVKIKKPIGTDLYASLNANKSLSTGRKDDLESLGYTFMYIYHKRLPWLKPISIEDIIDQKEDLYNTEFYKSSLSIFHNYFDYVNNLKFDEKPDYDKIKSILDEF